MSEEWSWYGKEEENDIVVEPMDAIAVYANANRDIVIRQQQSSGQEDDSIVIIPRMYAQAIIDAIGREIKATDV
ncbi:MAG: hypothetical protein HZA22_07550 [Nitrospirae bacterium]|nr:hypothetical protein [Nitrospirota bacterium]